MFASIVRQIQHLVKQQTKKEDKPTNLNSAKNKPGVLEGTLNWYKQGIREDHGRLWLDESQKTQRYCEA